VDRPEESVLLEAVEMAEEALRFIYDAEEALKSAGESASLCRPSQEVVDAIYAAQSVVELALRVARADYTRKVNDFEQATND
jgi:hypothetical protein